MTDKNKHIDTRRLKRLLQRMIDSYSPSGKEEAILEYLFGFLKRQGLPVQRQRVDDNRYNLVVIPAEVEPELVFMGHLDTVVAYELTLSGYTIKGDVITGLGSADMKGGCAAMIEAYLAGWRATSGHLPVALALVVGEEEEGDGAEQFAAEYNIPWVIIGEPTDLQPCFGSYGYLEVQLVSTGRRIHASLANQEESAVHALLHLVTKIIQHLEINRPELVVNVRDLLSSRAGFAAPERCEAWLDIHVPPSIQLETIVAELDELAAPSETNNDNLKTAIRFSNIYSGYSLTDSAPIAKTLKEIFTLHSLDWKPELFRSHSDANLLWNSGLRPIILGPGQLEQSHTPAESISFSQVRHAAEIYLALLMGIITG